VLHPGYERGGAGRDFRGGNLNLGNAETVGGDGEIQDLQNRADGGPIGSHRNPAFKRTSSLHVIGRERVRAANQTSQGPSKRFLAMENYLDATPRGGRRWRMIRAVRRALRAAKYLVVWSGAGRCGNVTGNWPGLFAVRGAKVEPFQNKAAAILARAKIGLGARRCGTNLWFGSWVKSTTYGRMLSGRKTKPALAKGADSAFRVAGRCGGAAVLLTDEIDARHRRNADTF